MKEFSVKIAASLLFYFAPVYELFIVLITFVFCDMVSGIVASFSESLYPHRMIFAG